jgi:hypothetical protein
MKTGHSAEQIVGLLRQTDVELLQVVGAGGQPRGLRQQGLGPGVGVALDLLVPRHGPARLRLFVLLGLDLLVPGTHEVDGTGLSKIAVDNQAAIDGAWTVMDLGTGAGRWDVLTAKKGIVGQFGRVILPGPGWHWGIDHGTTLWVGVPEPTSLLLLTPGCVVILVRQGQRR